MESSPPFFLVATFFCLMSCVSKSDYDQLKAQNERLAVELNECKYGAELLYQKSIEYLQSNDFEHAKAYFDTLLLRHSQSKTDTAVSSLGLRIQNALDLEKKKIADELKKAQEMELQIKQAEERRIAKAVSVMEKKHDDFKQLTWYKGREIAHYWDPLYVEIQLYFSVLDKESQAKNLRLCISSSATERQYASSYEFLIDGTVYDYTPVSIDYDEGREKSDQPVDRQLYMIITTILNGKSIRMRINGDRGHVDGEMYKDRIKGLTEVLDAYKALGGTLDFNY